jgi:hypothetical protein
MSTTLDTTANPTTDAVDFDELEELELQQSSGTLALAWTNLAFLLAEGYAEAPLFA